ncbi:hypothetical protein IWZ00DRAFT_494865 [Phyllosticta capitalensis]
MWVGVCGASADALLYWLATWQGGRTHAPSLAHRKHESINGRGQLDWRNSEITTGRSKAAGFDSRRRKESVCPAVSVRLLRPTSVRVSSSSLVSCDRTRVRKHAGPALRAEETLELVRWCLASEHALFLRAKVLTNHVSFQAATPSMVLIESDPFLVFSHHIQSAPPPAPLQGSRPPSDGGLGSL